MRRVIFYCHGILSRYKSEFIVAAVSEYLRSHSEVLSSGQIPRIIIQPTITQERLEELVRAILAERLPSVETAINMKTLPNEGTADPDLSAVAEMLGNVELFT